MPDYKATIEGSYGNGISWSSGWRITSNQALATLLATWSNAWNAAWVDATHGLESIYPTTTTLTEYTVAQLDGNYHEVQKQRANATLAGTSTDPTLPFQNSLLVSLRALPQIGRHARGRMYLPAPVSTAIVDDTVPVDVRTRVSNAVKAVQTAIQADGSTIFIVQLPKPKAVPPQPAGPKYVITLAEASSKPARQSKRVNKVKPSYT